MCIPRYSLLREITSLNNQLQTIFQDDEKVAEKTDDYIRLLAEKLRPCITKKLQLELEYLKKNKDLSAVAIKLYPNDLQKQDTYKLALNKIAMLNKLS